MNKHRHDALQETEGEKEETFLNKIIGGKDKKNARGNDSEGLTYIQVPEDKKQSNTIWIFPN